MPPALTRKLAGLPRWAWLVIISSGLLLGLYLRNRSKTAQAAADTGLPDDTYMGSSTLADSSDPGLAGVGLAANPAGSVVPVNSPTIPEGYPQAVTDITGALTAAITTLGDVRTAQIGAAAPAAVDNGLGSAAAETAAPTAPTGGGPPARPATGSKSSAPSTKALLAELRAPHSTAHRNHILAILKARGYHGPIPHPPKPKAKLKKKPRKAKPPKKKRARKRGAHH